MMFEIYQTEKLLYQYFLTKRSKTFSRIRSSAHKQVLILANKLDLEADLVGIGLFYREIDCERLNIEVPLLNCE
jgi:hypothetical protein